MGENQTIGESRKLSNGAALLTTDDKLKRSRPRNKLYLRPQPILLLTAFTTGNPFLGKILGISIGKGFGALKGLT